MRYIDQAENLKIKKELNQVIESLGNYDIVLKNLEEDKENLKAGNLSITDLHQKYQGILYGEMKITDNDSDFRYDYEAGLNAIKNNEDTVEAGLLFIGKVFKKIWEWIKSVFKWIANLFKRLFGIKDKNKTKLDEEESKTIENMLETCKKHGINPPIIEVLSKNGNNTGSVDVAKIYFEILQAVIVQNNTYMSSATFKNIGRQYSSFLDCVVKVLNSTSGLLGALNHQGDGNTGKIQSLTPENALNMSKLCEELNNMFNYEKSVDGLSMIPRFEKESSLFNKAINSFLLSTPQLDEESLNNAVKILEFPSEIVKALGSSIKNASSDVKIKYGGVKTHPTILFSNSEGEDNDVSGIQSDDNVKEKLAKAIKEYGSAYGRTILVPKLVEDELKVGYVTVLYLSGSIKEGEDGYTVGVAKHGRIGVLGLSFLSLGGDLSVYVSGFTAAAKSKGEIRFENLSSKLYSNLSGIKLEDGLKEILDIFGVNSRLPDISKFDPSKTFEELSSKVDSLKETPLAASIGRLLQLSLKEFSVLFEAMHSVRPPIDYVNSFYNHLGQCLVEYCKRQGKNASFSKENGFTIS